MRVTWEDLGCPEEPGDFQFEGGVLSVKAREIRIWREHPEAAFQVTPFRGTVGPKRYVLGSYEVPDG